MTRKIKELFMKYIRSNLIWCGIILLAKIYNNCIKIFRVFSFWKFRFWPPKIRNKQTKERCKQYNKQHTKEPAEYIKIYEPNKIHKRLPKTIEKAIHPTLLKYINEPQYEQFVANIPHGKTIGTYTNITPDYNILWDSTRYLWENIYSNPYTYRIYLWESRYVNKSIALLSSNDTYKNYYHRMLYVLPKFHLFQKSGVTIDKYATDYTSKFNKESLATLWINEDQIIVTSKDTYIEAKKLLVASTSTLFGNLPPRAINFLKKTFLEGEKPKKSSKRIYISRITNRKVENEEEIFSYLQKLWFEKIVLDNMSIKEQARLFNNTEIIIAPHGAWLTNLVFCQPWTKVIEMFHEKTVRGHYCALANACKLDYYYLIGDIQKDTKKISMDSNMYIPLGKLEKTLQLANML